MSSCAAIAAGGPGRIVAATAAAALALFARRRRFLVLPTRRAPRRAALLRAPAVQVSRLRCKMASKIPASAASASAQPTGAMALPPTGSEGAPAALQPAPAARRGPGGASHCGHPAGRRRDLGSAQGAAAAASLKPPMAAPPGTESVTMGFLACAECDARFFNTEMGPPRVNTRWNPEGCKCVGEACVPFFRKQQSSRPSAPVLLSSASPRRVATHVRRFRLLPTLQHSCGRATRREASTIPT